MNNYNNQKIQEENTGMNYAVQTQDNLVKHKKKHKGLLIFILAVVLVFVFSAVGIALFLPGFFGPKSLGIKSSIKAYESAMSKLHLSEENAYLTEDAVSIDTKLSSEELSSLLNYFDPDFKAFDKAQIRINKDDTIELSASISKDYFLEKMLDGQYSQEDLKKEIPVIGIIPESVNIYMKMQGEVSNNILSDFAISDISVMGISLPKSIFDKADLNSNLMSGLNSFMEDVVQKSDAEFSTIKAENGELIIQGDIPSSLLKDVYGNES